MSNQVLAKINNFCRFHVNESYSYLYKRGLDKDIIDFWNIGFFPSDYKSYLDSFSEDEINELIELKILHLSQDNQIYSPFSNRIIFPMYDCRGELLALSGRLTSNANEYKYINTVYPKKRHCFGLNFALPNIKEKNKAIIVEGQMDVITAHKSGLDIVVGAGGTAISDMHIGLLSRYANEIIILLDSDDAGQKVKTRLQNKLKNFSLFCNISYMELSPQYKDLDSFFKTNTYADFLRLYKNQFKRNLIC